VGFLALIALERLLMGFFGFLGQKV